MIEAFDKMKGTASTCRKGTEIYQVRNGPWSRLYTKLEMVLGLGFIMFRIEYISKLTRMDSKVRINIRGELLDAEGL